jgi:hypothetical protein
LSNLMTQKERAEQRRREKLTQVQDQLEDGSLKIRKMTPKERAEQPARPRPERGRRTGPSR